MLPVAAATDVIGWITVQPFFTQAQQTNYAVGLTTGDNMIISKVGGVTLQTNGMAALQAQLQTYPWYVAQQPQVHLAKKYTSGGVSNHGEMCVLAAADALADPLGHILCTGDNCPACADTLAAYGVATGNVTSGGTQTGWSHPRGRLAMGSSLGASWAQQMAELAAYNALGTPATRSAFGHLHTQRTSTDPHGDSQRIL
jgi:hypothetical protein